MTIVAIIGWLLFVCVLTLYIVGTKINARDENALAVYALCLLFSKDFREALANGFGRFAAESQSEEPSSVVLQLMRAVKKNASNHYLATAEVNTLGLAEHAIRAIMSSKA